MNSPRLCLLFLILRPQAEEHALAIRLFCESLTKQCLSQLNINRRPRSVVRDRGLLRIKLAILAH